jgi:lipid-A-disaccharide synthase
MKNVLIVAAEASSDMHAKNLINEILKKTNIEFSVSGIGGRELLSTGVFKQTYDNRDFSVSGFIEVFSRFFYIHKAFREVKKEIKNKTYDFAILIDYPGFNLPLAKFLYKNNIPLIYYIPPQVWAWKKNRVFKLKKYCNEIITILPFEKDFYSAMNVDVSYVGHPVVDSVDRYLEHANKKEIKKRFNIKDEIVISILPGSRHSEIKYTMPILEKTCNILKEKYKDKIKFIIPIAKSLKKEDVLKYVKNKELFCFHEGSSYDIYFISDYGLITSGTSTLEASLFSLPMTLVYKVSKISYFLFKYFLSYKNYIGMVNIILGKERVKEFFSFSPKPIDIAKDLIKNIENKDTYENFKKELNSVKEKILKNCKSPSSLCAKIVLRYL